MFLKKKLVKELTMPSILILIFHQLRLEEIIDGEEMEKVICLILKQYPNFKIQ